MESAIERGKSAICAECGHSFPTEEMIPFGTAYICATCKPAFIQKLSEGGGIRSVLHYVGFWWRFLASWMDGMIIFAINLIVAFATGMSFLQMAGVTRSSPALLIVTQLVGMIIGVAYEVFFIGKYGATPGKMACQIKIVTASGGRVSYALATGRYFAKILSALTLGIGYIMAAFDPEKRALHDRICDTRAVDKFQFMTAVLFK